MQKYRLPSLLPARFQCILFICTFILFAGCSGSKNSNGTSFVTGQIQMVSNEPFAKLGLVNDSSLYLIECSDEISKILYNNQGKAAKIYYTGIFKNAEGIRVLKAVNAEILKKQDAN